MTLFAVVVLIGCGAREVHPGGGSAGGAGAVGATGGAGGIGVDGGGGTSGASAPLGAAGTSGAAGDSAVGVGGSASGGDGGPSAVSQPVPDLGGVWTMIGFEDPLTVDLSQSNGVLAGRCFDTTILDPRDYSGHLNGTLVGRHARFDCPFDGHVGFGVAGDVVVSAQGNRMTGMFSFDDVSLYGWRGSFGGGPVTWLRASPAPSPPFLASQVTFGVVDQGVRQALERTLRTDLTLTAGTTAQQAFVRDRLYQLAAFPSNGGGIVGDLGAFAATEMAWHEDSQILEVGPVDETNADLPIGLKLRFSGTTLVEIDATMPSGTEYVFQATEHVDR